MSKSCPNFMKNGRKILGVAFNTKSFAETKNVSLPKHPALFFKPTSSYLAEGEPIVIPKALCDVSYEVELGVIIGRKCKNICKADAMKYVGGYCLAIDLTSHTALDAERAEGHSWTLGKGFDTATPVSRFIERKEIKDPNNLRLWLTLNGEMKQDGNTSELIFTAADIIEHATKYMTLEENDLILTGTVKGSGPLAAGDIVECGLGDIIKMQFEVCCESYI